MQLKLLSLAHSGISINIIIEHITDNIFIANSCEHRMGAFSMRSSWVFYEMLSNLHFYVSNNDLKFLAKMVAMRLGVLNGNA